MKQSSNLEIFGPKYFLALKKNFAPLWLCLRSPQQYIPGSQRASLPGDEGIETKITWNI